MSLAENCERKPSQINTNYLLVLATHFVIMPIFSNVCSMGMFWYFNYVHRHFTLLPPPLSFFHYALLMCVSFGINSLRLDRGIFTLKHSVKCDDHSIHKVHSVVIIESFLMFTFMAPAVQSKILMAHGGECIWNKMGKYTIFTKDSTDETQNQCCVMTGLSYFTKVAWDFSLDSSVLEQLTGLDFTQVFKILHVYLVTGLRS